MRCSQCPSQFLSFISLLLHFFYTTISSSFSSTQLCAPEQSLSLLQFKESFSINSSASSEICQYPKTMSWKEGTDCCLWDGVTCDMETGQVTKLNLACSMLYGTIHSNSTLFCLHHLQKLDLSDNDFNNSHISSQFGQFSNLTHLSLYFSVFAGQVPSEISHLSKLVSLDLSDNYDLCLEPVSFDKLVRNLTKLEQLDLSSANMSLVAPNSLRNLSSSLSSLILKSCGLQGMLAGNIFFLRPNFESLDLSYNEGLSSLFPSSNVSRVLTNLDLSYTRISIYLENDFFSDLKSLEYLSLRKCNIVSSNLVMFGNLTRLIQLDLSDNNFRGQIPSSLRSLVQLKFLNLSSNNFTGRIPDFLFTQLVDLDLSNNQLPGPIHSNKSTFPNLFLLRLSGNLLNGTIPSFRFANPSFWYLDLHNNQFTGNIGEFQHSSLEFVDLSNNHLHGRIPSSIFKQEKLKVLFLASNSKLIGEISSSICKLKSLQVLDLSNNSFSGSMPQCLVNFSDSLLVLHLGMNNLHGTIPSNFSSENSLKYLSLNDNEFEGEIPPSIINCIDLEVLDVGNNKIEDTFPYFLETLPQLQVLVLKSNKLKGFVNGPATNNSFHKLQIFDISCNNLRGPLPIDYFNSLEEMMASDQTMIYMGTTNYTSYKYSIRMTWKGSEIEFAKVQSTLTVLDFSNNNFTGEIPELIGKLKALEQLNLSHNSLTGHIQSSLGSLTNLESLDLSSNFLTGRIPMQLANLTFLQILNLSYNHLKGPIPRGKQFNTFDRLSFEGNLGLCGFPMPKECEIGEAPPVPLSNFHKGDDSTLFGDGFGWKTVALGYGCGFVFGVTIGYIVFKTRKPAWFLKMVEDHWNLKAKRTKKKACRSGVRRN